MYQSITPKLKVRIPDNSVVLAKGHLNPFTAPACTVSGFKSAQILIVQEPCESRGGRPGLSVLTSLLVSVDVKLC